MTPNAAYRLMNTMLSIHQELVDTHLPNIERNFAAARGLPPGSFSGKGRELSNEAHARTYVIDPILNELGWKVESTSRTVVESPAESNVSGEHRRFLDYFGRESSGDTTRPLLVVEAKRLSLSLPSLGHGNSPTTSVIDVIQAYLNDPDNSQGNHNEWHKIFKSVADYTRRLQDSPQLGPPKVLLLTNGDWFITLLSPHEVFSGNLNANNVIVSPDLVTAAGQADILQKLLAYERLCDNIPPQHWSELQHFVVGHNRESALPISWAVEVITKPWPDTEPLFGMTVVANILVPNGGWVRFRNRQDQEDMVTLLKDGELENDMAVLAGIAALLFENLTQYTALTEVSVGEFEATQGSSPFPATSLLSFERQYHYVLHLGKERRPFLGPTQFDTCRYHAHTACQSEGGPAHPTPILAKSTSPAAYFVNGSAMHCAHKVAQANRESRCQVKVLDEFLCCRRCALHSRCWPNGFGSFPCNEGD